MYRTMRIHAWQIDIVRQTVQTPKLYNAHRPLDADHERATQYLSILSHRTHRVCRVRVTDSEAV